MVPVGTTATDPTPVRGPTRPGDGAGIDEVLAARTMPVSSRRDRHLPVLGPLAPLLPTGVLQRGAVIRVDPGKGGRGAIPLGSGAGVGAGGATTLAFSLLAATSRTGSWCAAVGTADPGVLALAELGIDLDHLAIVPLSSRAGPGPSKATGRHLQLSSAWPEVTATLIGGMEIVLLRLPWPAHPRVARRLTARTRERQSVLIVLGPREWWPEGTDVHLEVLEGRWHGVGAGHGHLQSRRVKVKATGRRGAVRPVRTALWLPTSSGALGAQDT
jgi:hypothetical protein